MLVFGIARLAWKGNSPLAVNSSAEHKKLGHPEFGVAELLVWRVTCAVGLAP